MGFKAEVRVRGESGFSQNGEVWPDRDSAHAAGTDLWSRWTLVEDVRVVEVDDEPNRPTWKEWCETGHKPPRSVSL